VLDTVRRPGPVSSMATVGDCNDPQGVLLGLVTGRALDRQRRRTKLELAIAIAIAIADYIEHFYSQARRRSALDYLTPSESEDLHSAQPQATLS